MKPLRDSKLYKLIFIRSWKKIVSLTVAASLLFSLIVPPFAHAYSEPALPIPSVVEGSLSRAKSRGEVEDQSRKECLEAKQTEGFSARAESYRVTPESYRLTPESYKENHKLRRLLLSLRTDEAQAKVIKLAERVIPQERLPIVLKQYRQGLKRSGIKRLGASGHRDFNSGSRSNRAGANTLRLSGTHFKISSLKASITHLTALHLGPFLMHIRKIHENYDILNIPHSFAYFFRAVLDGDKDQNHRYVSRYTVSPVKPDSKWEFNTKMFIDDSYLPERFWKRVMKVYYEQWRVLINDSYRSELEDGEWVKHLKTKAERTVGDYLVKQKIEEEQDFLDKFDDIYKELINDEYDYMGTDTVFCGLYDGPGFIWDEDVFQLAYYYIDVDKLDDFTKQHAREDRKDENYYREGNFLIDRRYARILIEYGKKHGEEALRDLMIAHAERELLAQTRIHRGGQHANYDQIHDELLDEPGQKELMEFAKRAANDIRLSDFPDYVLVRYINDDIKENPSIFVMPENKVGGLFGNYLMHLYMTIKGHKSYSPQYARTIWNIFLMIRRDKELYLEFKRATEELLEGKEGEEELNALRHELDALRNIYMERLKEKEREKIFYGFSVRHPRFVRVFGREMIENNLDALLEFEKKVEKFSVKSDVAWGPEELAFYIFNYLFREVKDIVTSENFMVMAEDIFSLMRVYKDWYPVRDILEKTIEYFGHEQAAKKLHSLIKFAKDVPIPINRYVEWRVRFEGKYLRWLRPDTYRRIKKQKEEDSKKHWMQRVREKHLETWYGWILFFVTLSVAGPVFAYDGSSALTIWNEISNSVFSLLPYLTAGLVSVALGALFDRESSIDKVSSPPSASNLLSSKKGINKVDEIAEAVIDISQRAGDTEEVVREILTPTLYQALTGIVQENPVRVFINRADLKEQIGSLKKLMVQNEGEKRIEPVITINREFKEIEESEVKIELRNSGIDPKRVKIVDQPMTEDGKFSLKALLIEYPELLEDGYSLWVLNTESWIELIYEAINPMQLEKGIELVELDLKAELVTETAQ